MANGKVYLVGAGPGDPGLLTLRGKELLSQADAVVYDALVHPKILDFISERAEKIFRGHRSKKGALTQDQINALLVKLAKAGKMTVRLKGGDPFVFGRGAEEIMALVKAKVRFEVVPGVTSAVAVPAYAGIPVTHRDVNSTLTIVTGQETSSKLAEQIDWKCLAHNEGTIVFLMGLHTLKKITDKLMSLGKNPKTPVAVIQRGTTARQKTVVGTLETIFEKVQKARLIAPATLVVGKVVELRSKIDWLKEKPLHGVRALITRTRAQASYLGGLISEQGGEVIEIPTIEIDPLPLDKKGEERLNHLADYDWIVLASPNAVSFFMDNLQQMNKTKLDMGRVKIACVGASTAKQLKMFGFKADLVPNDYKQEGLVKEFSRMPVKGKKFLFARAQKGRELLNEFLEKRGALVDVWPLYKTKIPAGTKERVLRLFKTEGGVDLLIFASSSSVDNFYGILNAAERKKWVLSIPVAVIGPVTGESVKKWGAKVAILPKKYTMEDLIKGMIRWAGERKSF